MQRIMLLDCTLRDGGYVNDWNFGENNIKKIIQKSIQAGVDVIECGYLSVKNSGNKDTARFAKIEDVFRVYVSEKKTQQSYAVMINFGEYPIELLEGKTDEDLILRIAFHKKDAEKAFEYLKKVKELGFRFYIQPMGSMNYTDEEFVHLITMSNELKPEAFYIVDSFGVMELKDFRRLLFLADNNLDEDIDLGYHSHNNLQQAYSNSKYMAEQNMNHNIIIDASIFGMGRGAGNLNIELFAKYLNQNFNHSYNIEPFLEVFDECLKPIFVENFWGYSLPFYLSSIHNLHPNYAAFFAEKNTLSVKSMHELLSMISEEDKISFTADKATKYYNNYQENWIDDKEAVENIRQYLAGRELLILAPGKSLSTYEKNIKNFIEKHNPVVFGVNKVSENYVYDFLFIANEKRLQQDKPENVKSYITTSNLKVDTRENLIINYSSYLCDEYRVSDNPTLMLINLLTTIGRNNINIAGFDGFCSNQNDNYFEANMSLGSHLSTKIQRNDIIRKQVEKLKTKVNLEFLTPSLYL